MKKQLILLIWAVCSVSMSYAQNNLQITVKDAKTQAPLAGVSVLLKGIENQQVTNQEGKLELKNVPNGRQVLVTAFLGYASRQDTLTFPFESSTFDILLSPSEEELDEVIVESTRANRSIDDIPTRIEALTEEIDEAATMEPSRISHLITHSTGVQVQTTSATSNGAVLRIQGLQGRYSKLLKDGFPMYGGLSGSLDILQIAPLDLRQVEFIKGSSSTLHGGSAIGGVLNLLTKRAKKNETLLHLNRSSIGSNDLNAFVARKWGKWGFTNLASYQLHTAYDADKDGYSDLPELSKFNFNPKLFFSPTEKTNLYLGGMITREFRKGGDMHLIKNGEPDDVHFYQDAQQSSRYTSQFQFDTRVGEAGKIVLKNSLNFFDRYINIRQNKLGNRAVFAGKQFSSFTELTYNYLKGKQEWIVGANYITDDFEETSPPVTEPAIFFPLDEGRQTAGIFVNHVWTPIEYFSLESGIRTDWNSNSNIFGKDIGKWYVLPRLSALIRYNSKLTTRIGGGLGYRPLSIFNEEAEPFAFQNFLPVDYANAKAETSMGFTGDVHYRSQFGEKVLLSFNQMFYYNQLKNPIMLRSDLRFANNDRPIVTQGFETQVKLTVGKFTWFLGYTFTDAFLDMPEKQFLPLMPKHSIKGDLLFVEEGKWRIGWDYELKAGQKLSNGQNARDFFTTGVVIERTLGNFVLFFNAENITDVRQTRYQSLLTAPYNTPQFAEIYAPLDGRFFNAGIKITLE